MLEFILRFVYPQFFLCQGFNWKVSTVFRARRQLIDPLQSSAALTFSHEIFRAPLYLFTKRHVTRACERRV